MRPSRLPTISADGRYVAFASGSSKLTSGDNNGVQDLFVYDRQSNRPEIVSRTNGGALSNGDSFAPSVSAEGVLVAFHSQRTNLVSGDSNGVRDVLLRDRAFVRDTCIAVAPTTLLSSLLPFARAIAIGLPATALTLQQLALIIGRKQLRQGDAGSRRSDAGAQVW